MFVPFLALSEHTDVLITIYVARAQNIQCVGQMVAALYHNTAAALVLFANLPPIHPLPQIRPSPPPVIYRMSGRRFNRTKPHPGM